MLDGTRPDVLREAASGTERLLSDLGTLFAATDLGLGRRYEARRTAFAEKALPEALAELSQAIAGASARDALLRVLALRQADAIAERGVCAFLAEAEPVGEQPYAQATERFVTLTNTFLAELLAEEGEPGPAFNVLPGFQKQRGFFFTHVMSRTHVGFWTWFADVLRIRLVARVRRHSAEYLRELVYAKPMRIAGDLRDRVLESRRSLDDVTQRLTEAVAAGERAFTSARERHAAGSAAVAAELGQLAELRRQLDAITTVGGFSS